MTHCDSSSPFLHPSISGKKWWVGGLIVFPLGINPNMVSLSSIPLFFSVFLCSCCLFFFLSSRWEAFRVLPLAESLTNVALKCNEVWNGSCGYNYPRTGPVTGMISLSLAIRIGCVNESAWGRMMVRSGDRQWSQRIIWVCGVSKQVVHSWRDGVLAWGVLPAEVGLDHYSTYKWSISFFFVLFKWWSTTCLSLFTI